MVQNLESVGAPDSANPRAFRVSALLDGTTVSTNDWSTVATVEGTKSSAYGAGFGEKDRRTNTSGWSDFDLHLDGDANGDGTTDDVAAQGDFRYALYRDAQMDDLVATFGSLDAVTLRNRVSSSTTDKLLVPAHYSFTAGDDSVLALEYKGTDKNDSTGTVASEDGMTVDAGQSGVDAGLAYGEIKR